MLAASGVATASRHTRQCWPSKWATKRLVAYQTSSPSAANTRHWSPPWRFQEAPSSRLRLLGVQVSAQTVPPRVTRSSQTAPAGRAASTQPVAPCRKTAELALIWFGTRFRTMRSVSPTTINRPSAAKKIHRISTHQGVSAVGWTCGVIGSSPNHTSQRAACGLWLVACGFHNRVPAGAPRLAVGAPAGESPPNQQATGHKPQAVE